MKSSNRISLLAFGALAVLQAPFARAQITSDAGAKRNVLFILVDDMQLRALRQLGNQTPGARVINGLIDKSTRFDRCYTMGSIGGALSMPSRAMIMTGRTLFQTKSDGMVIPEKNTTLPEALRGNGYRTFATGKWHSDFESFNRSFSEGENIYFGGMHPYEKGGHAVPWLQHYSPNCTYKTDEKFYGKEFSSVMYADAAIGFLGSATSQQTPFFCYVAFTSPHDPHDKLPWYSEALDSVKMPVPKNFLERPAFDNGELSVRDETVVPAPRSRETVAYWNGRYGGMINEVGIQIGRILEALEQSGLDGNTIVVFAADNGLSMGQHGLMGKQSLYNHSVKAPPAIYTPGQSPSHVEGVCYLSDVNPTLYDLLGVEKPASVTGKSLAVAMKTGKTERPSLMLTYSSIQRALVKDDYKYIIYNVGGTVTKQLFNLAQDPWEMKNLALDPAHTMTVAKYEAELKAQMCENGDFCDLNNPKWWADGHKITWTEGINLIQ